MARLEIVDELLEFCLDSIHAPQIVVRGFLAGIEQGQDAGEQMLGAGEERLSHGRQLRRRHVVGQRGAAETLEAGLDDKASVGQGARGAVNNIGHAGRAGGHRCDLGE